MNYKVILGLLVIFVLNAQYITAQNEAPKVKNVIFSQRTDGTYLVDIYYDIYDPDGNQDRPYNAITKVEFYVDSTDNRPVHTEFIYRYCLGSNSGTNPCRNFNTNNLSSGRHKILILAYDSDGNIGKSGYSFTK